MALSFRQRLAVLDQLSTLLAAQIPLMETMVLVRSSQSDPAILGVIDDVKQGLGQGQSLANALGGASGGFDESTRALIHAGEASGTLTEILATLVAQMERQAALRQRMIHALTYPLVVLTLACVVSVALLVWVVPQFEALFTDHGAALPSATAWVISLAERLREDGTKLVGIMCIGIASIHYHRSRRSKLWQWAISKLSYLPWIGSWMKHHRASHIIGLLATLLNAGLSLTQALELVINGIPDGPVRLALIRAQQSIVAGAPLSEALHGHGLFQPLVIHLCQVGESSGQLGSLLEKAANLSHQHVNNGLEQLSNSIEPFMMITVGLLVGGLLVSLYLPIFQISSVMM